MRKISFAGIELTSQRVKRLQGYLSATGATGCYTIFNNRMATLGPIGKNDQHRLPRQKVLTGFNWVPIGIISGGKPTVIEPRATVI